MDVVVDVDGVDAEATIRAKLIIVLLQMRAIRVLQMLEEVNEKNKTEIISVHSGRNFPLSLFRFVCYYDL